MKYKSHIPLLIFTLGLMSLCSIDTRSQTLEGPKPQPTASPVLKKMLVTVNVVEGEPIKGALVKADGESVVVDMGAAEAVIKTDKVISLVFQPGETSPPISSEKTESKSTELAAADKVMSAMRRLDNAVGVGVTFQNYSSLLIESKSIVDENLNYVSSFEFRQAVTQALWDYQYAMQVWNMAVANGWAYFYTKQEPGRTLVTKYGYPAKISIWTQVPVMAGLNHVWISARNHFNNANMLYKGIGQ